MIAYQKRRFPTESGKFEFITSFPNLVREETEYPLYLISPKSREAINSQILERNQQQRLPEVIVHPQVAEAEGISQEEEALLVSRQGSLNITVRFDEGQRKDVVIFHQGGWMKKGRGVNLLTEDIMSNEGQGAAFHETRVRLDKLLG